MSGTPGKLGSDRCCAPLHKRRIDIARRASGITEQRCTRKGTKTVNGKLFCWEHAPMWATHYEIVERIRSIPSRGSVRLSSSLTTGAPK